MNGSTPGASLAYRNHADAIWNGNAPEKYTRLLPYIPVGGEILEIGSAEGVLSLLMATRPGALCVTGLEMRRERHEEAKRLKARWTELLECEVIPCFMELGDICARLELLRQVDTLVAIRTIYHLRGGALSVIQRAAAEGVKNVVLCGNKNRAYRFENGLIPHDDGLGVWNCYSSISGMTELLERAGYQSDVVVTEGDPIVTGRRR